MSVTRRLLPISVVLMSLALVACVDPPSDADSLPEPPHTLARFAHVAPDAPASPLAVAVDGVAKGSIALGEITDYSDFLFGERTVTVGPLDSVVNFGAEQQGTVYVYTAAGAENYLYVIEGDRYVSGGIDTLARVQFLNVSLGETGAMAFHRDSASGEVLAEGVASPGAAPYVNLAPGTYAIVAVTDSGAVATLAATTYEANRIYSVVAAGQGSSFQMMRYAIRQAGVARRADR
jgi:hypothetical protein